MKKEDLKQWRKFVVQFNNGWHISAHDWLEFNRLNHLVMEQANKIHNHNMLKDR